MFSAFTRGFITTAIAAVILLPGLSQPRVVEFNTAPEGYTMLEAMGVAQSYAAENGLVGCTTTDKADLDDVILAVPSENGSALPTSLDIQELNFDEALNSAGTRQNLLACKKV